MNNTSNVKSFTLPEQLAKMKVKDLYINEEILLKDKININGYGFLSK